MIPKRVLIWESLPFLGGGQRVSLQTGIALRDAGKYNVEFIVPGQGPFTEALAAAGFSYHIFPVRDYSLGRKRLTDYFRYAGDSCAIISEFIKLAGKRKFDLLYIGGPRALLWGAILGRLYKIPVVWHIHHVFSDHRIVWLLNRFGRRASVKKAICVSECVREQYTGISDKTRVLYNGVEVSRFNKSAERGIRCELGIEEDSKVLTLIGTLQPSKRQDVLIRALPLLFKRYSEIRVLLVGPVRQDHSGYEKQLSALVSSLDLDNKVFFIGHRDDIPSILYGSDISVLAGEEACPLTVLESCAAGVPVVGPDVAGAAELIGKSGAGMTYRYGDYEDLARVLGELLGNIALRQKYSDKGRDFATQYSMEVFHKMIEYEIAQALNG